MADGEFIFTVTATFLDKTYTLGQCSREYVNLKQIWDECLRNAFGVEPVLGERYAQVVPLPWSDEVRVVRSDNDLMNVMTEFEEKGVHNIHFKVDYLPLQTIHPKEFRAEITPDLDRLSQTGPQNRSQPPDQNMRLSRQNSLPPPMPTRRAQQENPHQNTRPTQVKQPTHKRRPNRRLFHNTKKPDVNLSPQNDGPLPQSPMPHTTEAQYPNQIHINPAESSCPDVRPQIYSPTQQPIQSDPISPNITVSDSDSEPNYEPDWSEDTSGSGSNSDSHLDSVNSDVNLTEPESVEGSIGSEGDGLSNVNEENVNEEGVIRDSSDSEGYNPNGGVAFQVESDGQIRLQVGHLFRNYKHFRQVMLDYSIQEGFILKRIKNERRRVTCVCEAEGCTWRVHGSPTYDRVTFMLKTLRNEHNCLSVSTNKGVTARWLANKFEKMIKENPDMKINVLAGIVLRKCGVTVPLYTLYRAKNIALNLGGEDHKTSYNKLHRYGHIILDKNPGSAVYVSSIPISPNPNVPASFQRFFLSFHSQKMGFLEGCRPFIGVDGCHLKGPFGGILLCAVAIDGNFGVYPIALCVCEIESKDSWVWFLRLLYDHVGAHERRMVCFMSDRQKGLGEALDVTWPNHINRFCARHILANMLKVYKVDYLKDLFWPAASSSNKIEFDKAMDNIRETSEGAYSYLMGISPSLWSIHAFDPYTKTDHNTNNIVESFNGWLNKYRGQPILDLMENVRKALTKRIFERHEAALKWESNLSPVVRRLIQKNQHKGRFLDPLRCGEWEFEVAEGDRQFTVWLDAQRCLCGRWGISGVPCRHAMACITKIRDDVEKYVHDYFKKPAYLKTYSHFIHSLPDETLWPDVQHGPIGPPVKKRRAGRPKVCRTRGPTEPARVQRSVGFRCSKCQQVGHNSRTCKNQPIPSTRTCARQSTGPSTSAAAPATTADVRTTMGSGRMIQARGRSGITTDPQMHAPTGPSTGGLETSTRTIRNSPTEADPSHAGPTGTSTVGYSQQQTITRVLWFPSSQPTQTQTSQLPSQPAPSQPTQPSQPDHATQSLN